MAVNDWLQLVTSEYALAPKYNAWLTAILQYPEDADAATDTIDNLNALDTATGIQLDMIGELLGVSRVLPFIPTYCPSPLTDDLYRLLIKGVIADRAWDGTMQGIQAITAALFPELIIEVQDNQDMTAVIMVISGTITPEVQELIEANLIIPKASGVGYTYAVTNNALFGWDSDTVYIKGYDAGYWV